MIKSMLIHLSMNFWEDWDNPAVAGTKAAGRCYQPYLRFDDEVWRKTIKDFSQAGGNMIVLDIGDGVRFTSHPEIAVDNAWSCYKLQEEHKRCQDLGLELIPKLNFSAGHDTWLGKYGRMVSTPEYYKVCRDLITETAELLKNPRFFHLGMDEETLKVQKNYRFVVIRQNGLWWEDLGFLCDCVRKTGARPWMWSDVFWFCSIEEFSENVAKDIIQSNWYYGDVFDLDNFNPTHPEDLGNEGRLRCYLQLNELKYDQIPTGSNWRYPENYAGTLKFAEENIDKEHFMGMMTAPWVQTTKPWQKYLDEATFQVAEAHKKANNLQ